MSGYVNLYQQHMDRSVWDTFDTSTLPDNLKEIMKCPTLSAGRPAHAPPLGHTHTHTHPHASRPHDANAGVRFRGAVVGPKEDAHVFCRAIENCEPLNAGTGDEFTLDAGDVALLRYRLIHDLVQEGRVALT